MFRPFQRPMPHVLFLAFGTAINGPVQFVRALCHRFGALHRVSGRIFAFSGTIFGFYSQYSPILELAFGIARTFGWSG